MPRFNFRTEKVCPENSGTAPAIGRELVLLHPSACTILLLGAFAKLREATISFAMFVRPSVRMEQLGYHWTDFREI